MNTELLSPVFDLSDASFATVRFLAAYGHLGTSSFQVKASGDGGASWDTLLTWTSSMSFLGPGVAVNLGLGSYIGSSEVMLSFHYTAPGWHYWAHVDQVRVVSDASHWFTVSPPAANVASGESSIVNLNIDSSELALGEHRGLILVIEDTPYQIAPIPLRLRLVSEDELFEDRFQQQP